MVTSEHMNQLLKNILNLIKANVGTDPAPWMTRIAGFTQQIIINTSEELLKDPFLPLAQKIRKRCEQMFHKEEALRGFIKSSAEDNSQVEAQLQGDWYLLVRDIYASYPLLIKYVDLQRNHWLRHDVPEGEELYEHIAEIFNIWSKSQVILHHFSDIVNSSNSSYHSVFLQYFGKEEQNFIAANEIDNMTLIMPTSASRKATVVQDQTPTGVTGKVVFLKILMGFF